MKLCILTIFIFNFFYSQTFKINYQQILLGKKTNTELLIDKETKNSVYYDYTKEIRIGTRYINDRDEEDGEWINVIDFFYKDYDNKQLYSLSGIKYVEKILMKEPMITNWSIDKNKTKNILGYFCYEARTHFRGRDYIAYFTEDIKFSDGPRKFSGLNGLILEIEEVSGKLKISAISMQETDERVIKKFDTNEAKNREEILSIAKLKYYEKKERVEAQFGNRGSVRIDFSGNLEIYDLN